MDVYSNFIHNCQNLEATKMFFKSEWTSKLWYIWALEYYSALKGNDQAMKELSSHEEEPQRHITK